MIPSNKPNYYFQCLFKKHKDTVGVFGLEGEFFGVFYSKSGARLMVEIIREHFTQISKSEIDAILEAINHSPLPEDSFEESEISKEDLRENFLEDYKKWRIKIQGSGTRMAVPKTVITPQRSGLLH